MRLDASAVLIWCWQPGELYRAAGLQSVLEGWWSWVWLTADEDRTARRCTRRGDPQASSPLYIWATTARRWPRGGGVFSLQSTLPVNSLTGAPRSFWYLIPDPNKLPAHIIPHSPPVQAEGSTLTWEISCGFVFSLLWISTPGLIPTQLSGCRPLLMLPRTPSLHCANPSTLALLCLSPMRHCYSWQQ